MPELNFADFHLLRPWWLLLSLPALWLAWRWASRRLGRSHWRERIDPALLSVLLTPADEPGNNAGRWLPLALLALVGLALAGPAWERKPQPVQQSNEALVIALDLSLSMYVEDVKPNRLVRARQEITDILRTRREGFTALIAYAGDAHTVAPLTDDATTIENLLSSLSPAMMPIPGSNVEDALRLAAQLHANAGMQRGQILLVTDGVDDISHVTKHRNVEFPISLLGIGTAQGGPIPLEFANQPGRFLQTNDGNTIVPKLDEERLRNIANMTHGDYQTAIVGDADIQRVTASRDPRDSVTETDRQFDDWLDRGYWLVLLALPLLLLCFRRGFVVTIGAVVPWLLLASMMAPPPAHAGFWDDLWQRPDQQARKHLREGAPEQAAALFEDPEWSAAANYRSGNYDDAARHYSKAADLTDIYNMGNSLAHLGNLERAIAAYDQVLAVQPEHEDALFNKQLLEKLLQEQQQASEQDNQEQQSEGGSDAENQRQQQQSGGSQPEQNQSSEGESPAQQQPEPEPAEQPATPGEEGEEAQMAQQERDENADALEQWLRRVPDDPGGLLQRKFQYEYKQRLRQGDYQQRNVEKPW